MTERNIRTFLVAVAMLFGVLAAPRASAQHTLGFTAGYGMGTGRFNPKQEMRGMWGMYGGGLTWRYYGKQRFVGGFGVDLEFLQQGFSFATNTAAVEEKKDYLYYTRNMNTVMLPVVWQPHIYMLRNHVRVYLERPQPSPTPSRPATRTSRLASRAIRPGAGTTPTSCPATTAGATDWPAAAAWPS